MGEGGARTRGFWSRRGASSALGVSKRNAFDGLDGRLDDPDNGGATMTRAVMGDGRWAMLMDADWG